MTLRHELEQEIIRLERGQGLSNCFLETIHNPARLARSGRTFLQMGESMSDAQFEKFINLRYEMYSNEKGTLCEDICNLLHSAIFAQAEAEWETTHADPDSLAEFEQRQSQEWAQLSLIELQQVENPHLF